MDLSAIQKVVKTLSLASVVMHVSCGETDDIAGRTSETTEISGVMAGAQPLSSISFTKLLSEDEFSEKAEIVDLSVDSESNGKFEIVLENGAYYFVEYSDERHSSWKDSIFIPGNNSELSINLKPPTYAWGLTGLIPIEDLPTASVYEIGFKGTPYFTRLDSSGHFSLEKALEGYELGVRFTHNQEKQWIELVDWSSEWFGIVDLKNVTYQDGKLIPDLCSSTSPTILLFSQKNDEHLASRWDPCDDDLAEPHLDERNHVLVADSMMVADSTKVADSVMESGQTPIGVLNVESHSEVLNVQYSEVLNVQPWRDELIHWSQDGRIVVYNQNDSTEVLVEMKLSPFLDMIRLSEDHLLVLSEDQLLQAIQLSTGKVITEKSIDNVGDLTQLEFIGSP